MAGTRYTKKSILSMVNSHVDPSNLLEFLRGKAKDIEALHDDTLICELITAVYPKIIKNVDDGRYYSTSMNEYDRLTKATLDANAKNLETLLGIICPHPESLTNFNALKTTLNMLNTSKLNQSSSDAKYRSLYNSIVYVSRKFRAAITNGDQLDDVLMLMTAADKTAFLSEQDKFWRDEDAKKAAEALAKQKLAEAKAREEAEARAKQEAAVKAAAEKARLEAAIKAAEEKARQDAAAKAAAKQLVPDGPALREKLMAANASNAAKANKEVTQHSPVSESTSEPEEDMLISPPSSPVPTLFATPGKRTAPAAPAPIPQQKRF